MDSICSITFTYWFSPYLQSMATEESRSVCKFILYVLGQTFNGSHGDSLFNSIANLHIAESTNSWKPETYRMEFFDMVYRGNVYRILFSHIIREEISKDIW